MMILERKSEGITKVITIHPAGTWMSEANFVPIHVENVEIFQWNIENFDLLVTTRWKVRGSLKSVDFILWGSWMFVQYNGNTLSSCWAISLWTSAVDRKTDIAISMATSLWKVNIHYVACNKFLNYRLTKEAPSDDDWIDLVFSIYAIEKFIYNLRTQKETLVENGTKWTTGVSYYI